MRILFDLTEFTDFLKTTDDVTQLVRQLTDLSDELFKSQADFPAILGRTTPYEIGRAILQLGKRHQLDAYNKGDVALFLNHLKEAIVSLPVVTVTLAFSPKQELLDRLSEWFLLNYQTKVVFHMYVDPAIIAGAVFEVNGKYADYSLRKKAMDLQTIEP